MSFCFQSEAEGGAAGAEDSLTSTEFDRFLAERAAAAENLPTISKDERALLGEVKAAESQEEDDVSAKPVVVAGNSARSSNPLPETHPKSSDDSLIQF